jgi:hypothetical protein
VGGSTGDCQPDTGSLPDKIAMKKLTKKPKEKKAVQCPVCGRYHTPNVTFGPFCCASCLQVVIRPLIVTKPER